MDNRKFIKKQNWAKRTWECRRAYSHHKTFGRTLGASTGDTRSWLTRLLFQQGNTCTAYTAVGIKEAMNPGTPYDPVKQWDAEQALNGGPSPDGITADTMMATGVKTGFYKVGESTPSDNEHAWFTITSTWSVDLFDQMWGALAGRPLACALDWYSDWDFSQGPVPHTFNRKLGGHMTKAFKGTATPQVLNGIPCIAFQGTWGPEYGNNGCFYFDRYMVNKCFFDVKYWGDVPPDGNKNLGLIAAIMVNIINLYHQLISKKNGWPPPFSPKLIQWANAIASCEGGNPKFNNPGNMKLSSLTASWGAQAGFQAKDGGWIAKFPTYQQGFTALCNFLKLGAENQLLAFHQARTLAQFTKIYAGNPPPTYLQKICQMTGATPETDIATFL